MTKDQMKSVREQYPHEVEAVINDMYEWQTPYLVNDLIRWMPKSEFMKLVHQMEDNSGE